MKTVKREFPEGFMEWMVEELGHADISEALNEYRGLTSFKIGDQIDYNGIESPFKAIIAESSEDCRKINVVRLTIPEAGKIVATRTPKDKKYITPKELIIYGTEPV